MTDVRDYYHVCSEGLEKMLIFRNRKEFILGMNYVAVCAHRFEVRVLCFCLMSNHFHFIFRGSFEECWRFGNEFKRMCAMMMRRNHESCNAMKDVEVQVKRIGDRGHLENAVGYVLRNPMAAGFRIMPNLYPWGSGQAYFRDCYIPAGRKASSFSVRKLAQTIRSKDRIPEDYVVDENGMISPLCYIDYRTVEELFSHPSRLLGSLYARKETEFELFLGIAENYNPDMEELRLSVLELIREEFGIKAISQLSMEQKIRLCGLMRRNFRASRKQIAYITRLNMETINRIV